MNGTSKHRLLDQDEKYAKDIDFLKKAIISYKDFPIPGVNFKDTFSLIGNTETYKVIIGIYCDLISNLNADVIIGLEARGFIIGGAISYKLGIPFVPVRKKGKLPGPLKSVEYAKEYGKDVLQIQENAIKPGQRVVIVDDVIATGGSLKATIDLVNSVGGTVVESIMILEIEELSWRKVLSEDKVTCFFSDK